MSGSTTAARRARRLVGWYPRSWRERFGDEFGALLESELEERPWSIRRGANVAWSGLVARAAVAGIAGMPDRLDVQGRRSLAWLAGSLAAFLCFALAMWSQLVVGWQWTSPRTEGTTVGTVVMSFGVLVLAALAAIALVPVLGAVALRIVRGDGERLVAPAVLATVSAVVLVVGAQHFENGWPGTGGHHWADQGLVPGGVAAFVWASTLGVTSYWAHPGALHAFPPSEVAWMAASPIAMLGLCIGIVLILRRLDLPARVLRLELRLGQLASVAMGAILFGAIQWLTDRASRPRAIPTNLFHVGTIDVVGAGVMAVALCCALQALRRGLAVLTRVA